MTEMQYQPDICTVGGRGGGDKRRKGRGRVGMGGAVNFEQSHSSSDHSQFTHLVTLYS